MLSGRKSKRSWARPFQDLRTPALDILAKKMNKMVLGCYGFDRATGEKDDALAIAVILTIFLRIAAQQSFLCWPNWKNSAKIWSKLFIKLESGRNSYEQLLYQFPDVGGTAFSEAYYTNMYWQEAYILNSQEKSPNVHRRPFTEYVHCTYPFAL